jgi:hypothetical protein
MKIPFLSKALLCFSGRFLCFHAMVFAVLATGSSSALDREFGRVVRTEQGGIEGFVLAPFKTVAWLGVPYAQPPIGQLRWKAPKDAASHAKVLKADSYGTPCFQPGTKSSEICLFLNIWRPDTRSPRIRKLLLAEQKSDAEAD